MNKKLIISMLATACFVTGCETLDREGIHFSEAPSNEAETEDSIMSQQATDAQKRTERKRTKSEQLNDSVEQEDAILRQLDENQKPGKVRKDTKHTKKRVDEKPLTEAEKEVDRDPLQDY